jgi:hypothetical protein
MSRDPTAEEILWIQILDATAGNPAELRRWIKIARGKRPKKDKGRPERVDAHWLLCAEALQRHSGGLSKTAAISKIANMFWSVHYAASRDTFRDRLLDAVRNTSLTEFAAVFAAEYGLRVQYDPSSGFTMLRSE